MRTLGVSGFSPQWLGPYRITKQVTPVTFELDVPATISKSPMFHVSQLHEWDVRDPVRFPLPIGFTRPPPVAMVDGQEIFAIDAIRKHAATRGRASVAGPVSYTWTVTLQGYPGHDQRTLDTEALMLWVRHAEAARRGVNPATMPLWVTLTAVQSLVQAYVQHLLSPTRLRADMPAGMKKFLQLWENERHRVLPGWTAQTPDLNLPA